MKNQQIEWEEKASPSVVAGNEYATRLEAQHGHFHFEISFHYGWDSFVLIISELVRKYEDVGAHWWYKGTIRMATVQEAKELAEKIAGD